MLNSTKYLLRQFCISGTDWMKRKIASGSSVNAKSGATGLGTKIATKHALMKQKALEEDPTVFQVNLCTCFI